jgi:endonuclease/exonuclease/phosphatase family metal-dependent hydrolase
MKILSWNILAEEWIKSSYYTKINKHILFNRFARFQRIVSILQNSKADIILLQEVMPSEYEMLKYHFNNNYIISPLALIQWKDEDKNEDGKKGTSGNMTLLSRNQKKFQTNFQDIKHYTFDFGLYTELREIGICNIHLDDLSKQTRIKQIKMLEDEILYRKNQFILGGDFNEEYQENSYIYHLNEFIVHNIDCPTYYIDKKMNIDNIMTRGFIAENNKQECFQYPISMQEGMLEYGSDHLPIIVEI